MIDIIVVVFLIITGILVGYLCYKYIIKPFILEPNCLIDTETCVKMSYWNYGNSVLFHMEPSGYWCWFNGEDVYVYDSIQNTETCSQSLTDCEDGENCRKITFTPAYKLTKVPFVYSSQDTSENVCIESIEELKEYYESLNVKKKFLHERIPYTFFRSHGYTTNGYKQLSVKFSVYDAINLFESKNIIKISK